MLLKGIGEVETAPDRRAAAEMVLIRLCHVADLPSPGRPGAPPERRARGGRRRRHRGIRCGRRRLAGRRWCAGRPAATGGGIAAVAAAEAAPRADGRRQAQQPHPPPHRSPPRPARQLKSFRDVAALVAERREAMLHAHLLHSVHLVRFAPPVIELRPAAGRAPRRRLPPGGAADRGHRHPLDHRAVHRAGPAHPGRAGQRGGCRRGGRRRRIIRWCRPFWPRFPAPGSTRCTTPRADAYGLPTESPLDMAADPPDMPDFAPPDAEPSEDMELDE